MNNYEKNFSKKSFKNIALWTMVIHLFSLAFFSIVGKFEKIDADFILKSGKGIAVLASTVTLSFLTIYGIYIIGKRLVIRYTGDFRERSYIYPAGRGNIFKKRLLGLIYRYSSVFLVCMCLLNTAYIFAFEGVKIFSTPARVFAILIYVCSTSILTVLVSVVILLCSIALGIKHQSTNIALITAVVLVACIGNVVAHSYLLGVITIDSINVSLLCIGYGLYKVLTNMIKNDDVMK